MLGCAAGPVDILPDAFFCYKNNKVGRTAAESTKEVNRSEKLACCSKTASDQILHGKI